MADELQLDLEQEVIRTRIDESRDALAQKIEKLEEKVTDTVESATASVAEATEAVRETVQTATASVSATVDSVAGAMQGTAETVRDSVEGAVEAVKETFDVNRMVERYPWAMVAGAVGVGFFAGRTFGRSPLSMPSYRSATQWTPRSAEQMFQSEGRESSYPGTTTGASPNGSALDLPTMSPRREASTPPREPSIFESLMSAFQPEISKLTRLAIGMGFDSLKHVVLTNTPVALRPQLSTMLDDVTKRVGGECLPRSMYSDTPDH